MSDDAVIAVRNLSFSYDGHLVLQDVDLDILAGDFVSIIGPNGGGKTTLLKLCLGLLTPQRGTVRIFGTSPQASRQRIGYMPQHVSLDSSFPVTALDVVLMGRMGCSFPAGPFRRADRAAAERAMQDVSAEELGRRPFFDLSGGQRQRVLIARALAGDPRLLLLDEPTASLDPAVQDDLYELLRELNRRMTVVIVSHDVSAVSQHVRKVICVNRQVEIHPASTISGELARVLYQGVSAVRLVRHDQCDGGHPEHPKSGRHDGHGSGLRVADQPPRHGADH